MNNDLIWKQPFWDMNDYQRDFVWLGIDRRLLMNEYIATPKMVEQIDNNFTYHPPIGTQQERYVDLRETAKGLAYKACNNCPTSRELSLALTKLEEFVFWANAAIARNETLEKK